MKLLFPAITWDLRGEDACIYLTFDDGPVPGITSDILHLLNEYNAKATFFCVGENIKKYPEVFFELVKSNHTVGNHTYHHLSGWKVSTSAYLDDVALCDRVLQEYTGTPRVKLFRPPHGRLTLKQYRKLKNDYRVVMWDVLSMDYAEDLSPEKCLDAVLRYTSEGSIIVFHDSLRTENTVKFVLPKILDFFTNRNYCFRSLGEYYN